MLESLLPASIVEAFAAYPSATPWKWLFLAGLSVGVCILAALEQRRMHRYYQRLTSAASTKDNTAADYSLELLSLATRNRFLFAMSFVLLTFSVIFYDVKQRHAEDMAAIQSQPTAEKAEQPIECPPQITEAPPPTQALDEANETALDELKKRYEQAYVNLYLLHKCNAAGLDDFVIMNSALLQDLSTLNASATFPQDVRTTAKSTFDELYKTTDCNQEAIAPTLAAHKTYIKAVRESLSAHFKM